MITNIQQNDNVLRRQQAWQRQRHQQEFQQRQERQRQQQEEQQRLRQEQERLRHIERQHQHQRELRHRERRQQRYEQWQDRLYRRRRQQEPDEQYFNKMMTCDPMEEPMDDDYNESLLDAYDYEKMNPQERQEAWEQQHLNELQGIFSRPYYGVPLDNLQRFAIQQEEQLWLDEHEQTMRIYDMESWDRIQQYQRNTEELIQKEQWEEIAFLLVHQLQ